MMVIKARALDGATIALMGAWLVACHAPTPEDEAQIRELFSQLSNELPGATPADITLYLTETDHHEEEDPYHHRPALELLMRFSSVQELEMEVRSITVTDGRAHVRCSIRGIETGPDRSGEPVSQEQIFELLRDPGGWRIADHVIS
ncbi:MAG TPA: hypothetical protein VLK65_05665 [Vicinamibacteria bacterium]|nr:hypothetical protein [Vicinamibacteria bacterium]